jgi:hypothetical protein
MAHDVVPLQRSPSDDCACDHECCHRTEDADEKERCAVALVLNAVLFGLGLSLFLGALILGSLRLDPTMWVHSYPPDIREQFGPTPPRSRGRVVLVGLLVYASLAVAIWLALRQVPTLPGGELTAPQIFLTVWLVLGVFNLVDLLVIDWFLLGFLQPRWVVLPGTDPSMAGYHDYGYHFRGLLKGLVITTVASAVITGAVVFVRYLLA